MAELSMNTIKQAWDNGYKTIMHKIPLEYVQKMQSKLQESNIDYLQIPMENEYIFAIFKRDQNAFLDIQKEVYSFQFSVEGQKNNIITIMHGSDHEIKEPKYGLGSTDCDYGRGFYTTQNKEKADLWALTTGKNDSSVTNIYEIDLENLNVLNLDDYGVLAWVAEIAYNRTPQDELAIIASEMLIDMYKVDTSNVDVIIGYRAGGLYMDVLNNFLLGNLTITEVENLFKKDELGLQICLVSPKAFEKVKFIKSYECQASKEDIYLPERKARQEVLKFLNQRQEDLRHGYQLQGLTIDDVTQDYFQYNKDTKFYELGGPERV